MMAGLRARPSSSGLWDRAARTAAYGLMLFCVVCFAVGVVLFPAFARSHPEKYLVNGWTQAEMDLVLSGLGMSFSGWITFNLVSSILVVLVLGGISLLILFKRGQDRFSLYVATAFILFSTFSGHTAAIVGGAFPALQPALVPLSVYAWMSIFMIFFAFPDGRFVPTWVGGAAGLLVITFTITILRQGSDSPPVPMLLLIFGLIGVGVGNQIYRYRNISTPSQRQQTKMVLFSLMLIFTILLASAVPLIQGRAIDPGSPAALLMLAFSGTSGFIVGMLPLSIAVAILRYRLWDIDVLIRRTLVYALVSGMLGMVYLGVVTILQAVFESASQQSSTLGIVLSTLVIAAIFNPLRLRIQNGVDRRFYRQKYNAEQALSVFAAAARQETNLVELTRQVVGVVEQTVQPEQISLWLRPASFSTRDRKEGNNFG
jgi:hypothetical protein